MTRKKVKLVRIGNAAARRACFKKRTAGLRKKVQELTTLCGVDGFIIMYSPDEDEPAMWPSRPELEEMLRKFESIPKLERSKKMTDQQSYLKERIDKAEDLLKKNSKKNRDAEMSCLMHKLRLGGFNLDCLELDEKNRLISLLQERREDYEKRMNYFQQVPPLALSSPQPIAFDPSDVERRVQQCVGEYRANPTDSMMWDPWFVDMMRNSNNVAGSSGASGPDGPPQGFNFGGFAGTVDGVGVTGLGLRSEGGNPFDLALAPTNPNPFGNSFLQGDFGGMNSMGLGPNPPTNDGGFDGFQGGLNGYFPSGSDLPKLP